MVYERSGACEEPGWLYESRSTVYDLISPGLDAQVD